MPKKGDTLIIMLGGGDKSSQQADIAKAKQLCTNKTMSRKTRIADLPEFDMARQLKYCRLCDYGD